MLAKQLHKETATLNSMTNGKSKPMDLQKLIGPLYIGNLRYTTGRRIAED
jgi:hypothetical protein